MRATLRSLGFATLASFTASMLANGSLRAQAPPTNQASPQSKAPAATGATAPGPATQNRVYIYPLETQLVHSLDPTAVKPGDHVLTKLSHIWTDGDCTLAAGSAVSGEVLTVHEWTRQDKQTRVTLQFRYTCNNAPRTLRLITLFAPEYPDILGIHGNPVTMQAMRSSLNGEGNPLRPAGNTFDNHPDMSGQQNPQWPLFIDTEPKSDHRPTVVKRGMVWHLPGVGLEISDGAPPTTSIYSSHHSFKLPAETVLIMQPDLPSSDRPATEAASSAGNEPKTLTPRKQLAALTPEITACPAATCNEFASSALSLSKPEQEISLRRYGHLRGQTGEIAGLEYSAAVAFLGSDELLVCVNKPGLVQRTGVERPEDHPHLVEAVLYDRRTGKVEHTAEWVIPNHDRYLWPLPDGRVLVHRGDDLVWYGPGLTADHTLELHAPLASVHTTGDGHHLLIGTIRELHSTAEHAELYHNDSRAPEEEVRETVYDDNFHVVSEHGESSRALAPLVWDTGRIRLHHRSSTVWYFRELRWDGTERDFGTITSSCVPQTTALSGNMLLVIGCDAHSLNASARILRPDGSMVLRTTVHPSDLYPVASAISPGNVILVSPRLNSSANREGTLHASDITGETVRVLRATDGHLKFATDVHQPTTSAQPAAIDSTGSTIAILDGDAVRIYSLATPPAANTNAQNHTGAF